MALIMPLLILLLLSQFSHLRSVEDNGNSHRHDCPPFPCGKLGDLKFLYTHVYRPHCGLLVVNGCNKTKQSVQLQQGRRRFRVYTISQSNTLTIYDQILAEQLKEKDCQSLKNLTLPNLPYVSFEIASNVTLCKCKTSSNVSFSKQVQFISTYCTNYTIYYRRRPNPPNANENDRLSSLCNCPTIQLPFTDIPPNDVVLFDLLTPNISVQVRVSVDCWKCHRRGGECLVRKQRFYCDTGKEMNKLGVKLALGLAVPVATILLVSTMCFVALSFKSLICRGKMKDSSRIEAFIKKFGSLAPRRYSYGEIQKITNKFNDKLGQGGYGSVYKGKLLDGCLVAVKILNESKGDGEDFMNEIASIGRTSHVNIVALLGFCFEKSKKALVYEFMPHGSLDTFIYDRGLRHQGRRLEWKTLYDIVLGIATGLDYLHQGCNARILHFDIKPHNILLDENFCPKISDFGLSKLCERKESGVSMVGARGTIGYIAPELVFRNIGGISHKSDVYSYGMMVLEIVGGRRNIDVEVSRTSELYFPSWICKHLDQYMNLNLNEVIVEEEEITKKLIIVSLWCIQHDPSDRPSMKKVMEMLQGSLQSLIIPSRPFLFSPVQSS